MPERATVTVGSEASLVTVMLPEAAPELVGANLTCTEALWPTCRVPEGAPPTTENAAPDMVACEMSTVPVPVLVKVKVWVAELATATSPNERVVALAERTPVPEVPGPVLAALV